MKNTKPTKNNNSSSDQHSSPESEEMKTSTDNGRGNRPIEGQAGFSPNAKYAPHFKNFPQIPDRNNKAQIVQPILDSAPQVITKDILRTMHFSIRTEHDRLGLFTIRDDVVDDMFNKTYTAILPMYNTTLDLQQGNYQLLLDGIKRFLVIQQIYAKMPEHEKLKASWFKSYSTLQLKIPKLLAQMLSTLGDIHTDQGRFEMLGGELQMRSFLQYGLFNHLTNMNDPTNTISRQIRDIKYTPPNEVTHQGQQFIFPTRNLNANEINLINSLPEKDAAIIHLKMRFNPNAFAQLGFTLINGNDTFQQALLDMQAQINQYDTATSASKLSFFSYPSIPKTGNACQLVRAVVNQPRTATADIVLSADDIAIGSAFNMNQSFIDTQQIKGNFSQPRDVMINELIMHARTDNFDNA